MRVPTITNNMDCLGPSFTKWCINLSLSSYLYHIYNLFRLLYPMSPELLIISHTCSIGKRSCWILRKLMKNVYARSFQKGLSESTTKSALYFWKVDWPAFPKRWCNTSWITVLSSHTVGNVHLQWQRHNTYKQLSLLLLHIPNRILIVLAMLLPQESSKWIHVEDFLLYDYLYPFTQVLVYINWKTSTKTQYRNNI